MVKMKDVAELAGVSVATVSNVITGKRAVGQDVREKVLDAIRELDYHVNMVARGLKTQKTNTIGVVLPDITKLFFNDVLNGIMTAAGENGYSITILSSNYDFETEKQQIAMLRGNHVDAIILDSCVDFDKAEDWGRELVGAGDDSLPIISLEDMLNEEHISCISMDCSRWTSAMTEHLLQQGRRRIFYISGPSTLMHEHFRLEGYKAALIKNGLQVDSELIAYSDFLSHSGYDVVKNALESGLEFDAVQASNDQAGIGAIKALKEAGIDIPTQVAVTGFDNLFPATLISPSLTTLMVPRYYMGFEAVRESIRRIDDPNAPPNHLVLGSQLIVRSSSRSVPDADWDLCNW